jgi:hypothetical protein
MKRDNLQQLKSKKVFIVADHGLAIVYFLQTDLVTTLLESGIEIVFLTDDGLLEKINQRFGRPGLTIEGLRLQQARDYFQNVHNSQQWWLDFFRRASASNRMNLETINNYVNWVKTESPSKRRSIFPLVQAAVGVFRNSKYARQALIKWQHRFSPNLYDDLFKKYQPNLVVASTAGWRLDRYILRAARTHGVQNAAIVLGWDNPSSHALPGAIIDHISCWSEVQKQELIEGSDWQAEQINIGGIPSYDGYFRKQWLMPRDDYFRLHKLDPERRLLGYACSFVTYSPNLQNVEALARLIARNELASPCQLLVRLHPNHYTKVKRWAMERDQMQKLTQEYPHIHLVEPVPLGGEMGYYSGEDMPEKSSMMAHSDVFLTVYSTMVVEASIHESPIVSVVIDSPTGWPGEYSLPLSKIGGWPTHSRFRQAAAGRVATNTAELRQAINNYLENPGQDRAAQRAFVAQECTYTDGSAGKRTADYLLSLV